MPGPTIKFPGAYKIEDPELHLEEGIEQYDEQKEQIWWTTGFLNYTAPGPAVWTG